MKKEYITPRSNCGEMLLPEMMDTFLGIATHSGGSKPVVAPPMVKGA